MKKLLMFAALAVALTGCGQRHETEGVDFRDADKYEGYNNVDEHPNVVRLCIDGLALATTTRPGDGVTRVPEWDSWCGSTR